MAKYIAFIHKDPDSDYGVCFPDFPGCISAGANLDEVAKMAHEALKGHIDVMQEQGEKIPLPMALEEALNHEFAEDSVAVIVVDGPSGKTVRFNMTAPESDLDLIDRAARARGMTRSGFMVSAAIIAAGTESTGKQA